jgi:hypothetical protein
VPDSTRNHEALTLADFDLAFGPWSELEHHGELTRDKIEHLVAVGVHFAAVRRRAIHDREPKLEAINRRWRSELGFANGSVPVLAECNREFLE